jgi:hypothetical protein
MVGLLNPNGQSNAVTLTKFSQSLVFDEESDVVLDTD